MFTGLKTRLRAMSGGGADRHVVERRRASADVAAGWWVDALSSRAGTDAANLAGFGTALSTELVARLDETYRVYLEVNHQPKGILRAVALETGVDVDHFPAATTMSVSDSKVEVSKAAQAPYEVLHTG